MAKVLQNFLIGVGLDTEDYDKGAKNVESSLSRMRSLVGFTGIAFIGAFGAAGAAAIGAGKRVLDFNNAAEKLKTPTEYVYAYGRALEALGGNANDALTAISAIEKAQGDLALKGMLGPLEDVALARADINVLSETNDGKEFLRTLAPMIQDMNKDQQRLVQDTLGLSDVVMISLKDGADALDARIEQASTLYGEFGRATEAAREYSRAVAELNTRFEGIGETLAVNILPSFTSVIDSLGGFIDRNRDLVDRVTKESPVASTAAMAGATAATIGVGAKSLGLKTIGQSLVRGGGVGLAVGGGLIAADLKPDDIESLTGYRPPEYIFENTPLDAVQDAYNKTTDSLGLERSGAGAFDYLRGGQDRFGNELTSINDRLSDYVRLANVPRMPGSQNDVVPTVEPHNEFMSLNETHYHDNYQPQPIVESPTSGFVEPIYSGGEIDNSEAASVNPEVVIINGQRQQSENNVRQRPIKVENKVDLNVEIDGRPIEAKVIDVMERRERDAMDDVYSTVDR